MFSGKVVPSVSEDSFYDRWHACNAGRSAPESYRIRLDAWNEIKKHFNLKDDNDGMS